MLDLLPYLDKPFADNGRGPDAFDCYGLVQALYRDLGRPLPGYASTGEPSLIHALMDEALPLFARVEAPEPYAIAAFSDRHPGFVGHFGLVLEDSARFVHIRRGQCAAVERLAAPRWASKLRGLYRWIG